MNYLTRTDTIPPGAIVIPLDASSLKRSGCQKEYVYSIVHGYRKAGVTEWEAMGKAIHRYAEVIARYPDDMCDAVDQAKVEWNKFSRDNAQLIATCAAMPSNLPRPYRWDGEDSIETFFRAPWLTFTNEGKVYCIVLMGTIDLWSFNGELVTVTDYKSSRKWKREEVFAQYDNDSQLYFYMWVMKKFGRRLTCERAYADPEDDGRTRRREYKLPLAVVEAAEAGRIVAQVCAVQLMTTPKWTLAPVQGLSAVKASSFEDELLSHIHTDLIPAWLDPAGAAKNGWIAGKCSQCNYNILCHLEDDDMFNTILDNQYRVKPYNPQAHTQ